MVFPVCVFSAGTDETSHLFQNTPPRLCGVFRIEPIKCRRLTVHSRQHLRCILCVVQSCNDVFQPTIGVFVSTFASFVWKVFTLFFHLF